MKKTKILAFVLAFAMLSLTACNGTPSSSTPSEDANSVAESTSSDATESSDATDSSEVTTAAITGTVTASTDERYAFATDAVNGTADDLATVETAIAGLKDNVTNIYITKNGVEAERELTAEEVDTIIATLQAAKFTTYAESAVIAEGNDTLNLVAGNTEYVTLQIMFNGEQVIVKTQGSETVFLFNGAESGLGALMDVVAPKA